LTSLKMATPSHISVLLQEAIEALQVKPGGRYIDCTLGGGGHAAALLAHSSPSGRLLGIDADPEAITITRARLKAYNDSTLLINENFANLQVICIRYDFLPVHGILFDLGLSSLQLDSLSRGFSFQHDGPLDMRFSPEQEITASDIVNTSSESELAHLIKTYGEERYSRRIAHYIVEKRPLKSTLQLAQVIERAVGGRKGRIHAATRTFQALRIAVNHELEHLELALRQAVNLLVPQGRLVVISYHSLEDRIVKQFMQRETKGCLCPPDIPTCVCGHTASLRLIRKKVITPSPSEVERNPRSRSAKLRVAERIVTQDEQYEIAEKLCCSVPIKANGWRRPATLKKLQEWLDYEPVGTFSRLG